MMQLTYRNFLFQDGFFSFEGWLGKLWIHILILYSSRIKAEEEISSSGLLHWEINIGQGHWVVITLFGYWLLRDGSSGVVIMTAVTRVRTVVQANIVALVCTVGWLGLGSGERSTENHYHGNMAATRGEEGQNEWFLVWEQSCGATHYHGGRPISSLNLLSTSRYLPQFGQLLAKQL